MTLIRRFHPWLCRLLRRLKCSPSAGGPHDPLAEGFDACGGWPPQDAADASRQSQDVQAIIAELSRAAQDHPEAVDILVALGSLHRDQGDLEQAVRLRRALLSRRGLPSAVRARVLCELGRDYKRGGFIDRARLALEEADALAGAGNPAGSELGVRIVSELARLAAQTSDFVQAASHYGRLGQPQAQAHYLARQAQALAEAGLRDEADARLRAALKAHPGSPEAWLELLRRERRLGRDPARRLRAALQAVRPELRFVLLEGLLEGLRAGPPLPPLDPQPILDVLADQPLDSPEDASVAAYGALLLIADGRPDDARLWARRAVSLDSGCWPARLALMDLGMGEQALTPVFREQLAFFLNRARAVNRFLCRACGLRQDRLFFLCPRCASWHSIGLRSLLKD